MIQLTVKVRKAAIPTRGEKQSGMGLSGTFADMPWASCSTSTLDTPGEQTEFFPTYLKTLPWFLCVQICASCDGNIKKLGLKVCRWSVEVYNKTRLSNVPLLSCLRSEFNWYLYLSCSYHHQVNQSVWVSDCHSAIASPHPFECQSNNGQLEGKVRKWKVSLVTPEDSVTHLCKSTVWLYHLPLTSRPRTDLCEFRWGYLCQVAVVAVKILPWGPVSGCVVMSCWIFVPSSPSCLGFGVFLLCIYNCAQTPVMQ